MCCIGRGTVDELKDMIALLQQADFDPTDVDTDLHKRVASAIQDGFIKHFDMRVSSRDGNQDLSMWMLDVEEVVREIMGDTRFAGHQHFIFEAAVDEDCQCLYGGEANERVAFQIGQNSVKLGD